MSYIFRAAVSALCLGSAGCAIHPLPEDVTGVETYFIVRQIRCETRQAVFDTAVGWLTHDEKVDPVSRAIGLEFADGTRRFETLSPKLFKDRHVRAVMQLFWDTGVAYNYNLDMTETNGVGVGIDFLKPIIHGGKFTLGAAAGAKGQRENTRTFTVTDTFGKLVALPSDYCTNQIVEKNYVYPIAGKIGMAHVIQDFIKLTLFGNLAGPKDNPAGPPTMVDQLQFTTTISGSLTPRVDFSPVGNAFQVVDVFATPGVSRTDLHTVTVGLAIARSDLPQLAPLRSQLFAPLLTATGGRTEQAAAEAVNQALTLKLFQRTIIVAP